jgi:hypothetical protein
VPFRKTSNGTMGNDPCMSAFMVGLQKEKSPAKLAHLLMASEMRKGKAAGCMEASIHRFLACGFMAKSTSNLGGLPGLIFGKRSLLSSRFTSSAAAEQQRVREHFNCNVEPSVVDHQLLTISC